MTRRRLPLGRALVLLAIVAGFVVAGAVIVLVTVVGRL
jgi:hypothetical protein